MTKSIYVSLIVHLLSIMCESYSELFTRLCLEEPSVPISISECDVNKLKTLLVVFLYINVGYFITRIMTV